MRAHVKQERRRLFEISLVHSLALDVQGKGCVEDPVVVRTIGVKAREMLLDLGQLGRVHDDLAWLICSELCDDVLTNEEAKCAGVNG